MAKNNFLKNFLHKQKEKKLLKQLKKLKEEHNVYDKKLSEGKLNNKELKKYDELEEALKNMAKKFSVKDGKLVLNEQQGETMKEKQNDNVEVENKSKDYTEASPTPEKMEEVYNEQEAQQIQKEAEMRAQIQAQHQAQMRRQMEIARAQQQAQMQAQQQAQMQEQQQAQMQAQQQAQMQAQQQAQMQAQQQPQMQAQQQRDVMIALYVQDMPELNARINVSQIKEFEKELHEHVLNNAPFFRFGPNNIVTSKIIMYRFKELEQ